MGERLYDGGREKDGFIDGGLFFLGEKGRVCVLDGLYMCYAFLCMYGSPRITSTREMDLGWLHCAVEP